MAEPKFKHQLIVEVTFDEAILEGEAALVFGQGLRSSDLNDRVRRFYFVPKPQIHNIKVKRLSRVLPHLTKPKE